MCCISNPERAPQLYKLLAVICHLTVYHGEARNVSELADAIGQEPAHVFVRLSSLERQGLVWWQRNGRGRPGRFGATRAALRRFKPV